MAVARFRFSGELNDFLAPQRRSREFEHRCARAATVKNAIEALGVPHSEVELILMNSRAVDLTYRVRDGDRVDVLPKFEGAGLEPLLRVRARAAKLTGIKPCGARSAILEKEDEWMRWTTNGSRSCA